MPREEALRYAPSLESFRPACQKITAFYFIERYPFITEVSVTEVDVHDSLKQVEGLIENLRTGTAA